ncbi:MAG TPA: hypothetical protein PK280_17445 [Planctomycetota bacterium]|nr:hypothetical protein [Planctomycetota bacterium]
MFRASAAVLMAIALAGCAKKSFVDAPVNYDHQLRKGDRTDLSFVAAPVGEVVAQMETKSHCRITVTNQARSAIAAGDLRITAQVEPLPKELAFSVLQAELEFKGLVLIAQDNALGRPAYVLDRAKLRELSVPGDAARVSAKGGADF